jgi:hypothetical protein
MKDIHDGLEPKEFTEPTEGLTRVTVTRRSGLLPTEDYQGETYEEVFISGTEPREFDELQDFEERQRPLLVDRLRRGIEERAYSLDTSVPTARPEQRSEDRESAMDLDLDLDLELASRDSGFAPSGSGTTGGGDGEDEEEGNPLLD